MKKRIFAATLVAILALGSYIAVQSRHSSNDGGKFALEDIEASAQCEVKNAEGQVIITCEGDNIICEGSETVVGDIVIACMGEKAL